MAPMNELWGVLAAMLSSALGGAAVGATRYVAGQIDPLALGALRFGIGVALLAPLARWQRVPWPARADVPACIALGLLFFGLFPVLFNASLHDTTAARGALALSTLPLLTMLAGALLKAEAMTVRKTAGVLVAMSGVAFALIGGLASAPPMAWRGDALMIGAALCMALYNIGSRPIIRRSGAVQFTVLAMAAGATVLTALSAARGSFAPLARFDAPQWLAVGYLGVFGGAIGFFLWAYALARTTPTQVAISVTVNPLAASLVGVTLLHEPIGWNLIVGLVAVCAGICIAVTGARRTGT
jgi:drug/metabolite transporter (DMT)-like permease